MFPFQKPKGNMLFSLIQTKEPETVVPEKSLKRQVWLRWKLPFNLPKSPALESNGQEKDFLLDRAVICRKLFLKKEGGGSEVTTFKMCTFSFMYMKDNKHESIRWHTHTLQVQIT